MNEIFSVPTGDLSSAQIQKTSGDAEIKTVEKYRFRSNHIIN